MIVITMLFSAQNYITKHNEGMYMKKILILVLSLLMVACVNYQPIPEGYQGPLAMVNDTSTDVSSTKVQFFQLSKVDERNVMTSAGVTYQTNYGRGFFMDVVTTGREVPATECKLHIQGMTHVAAPILAFGGGMYSVEGDVDVTLEDGKDYFVKGELSKEYSAVWVEDDEGNIISQKVEKRSK